MAAVVAAAGCYQAPAVCVGGAGEAAGPGPDGSSADAGAALPDGRKLPDAVPLPDAPPGMDCAVEIGAGDGFACARRLGGGGGGWGGDDSGQRGRGAARGG